MDGRKIYFGVDQKKWLLVAFASVVSLSVLATSQRDLSNNNTLINLGLSVGMTLFAYVVARSMTNGDTELIEEQRLLHQRQQIESDQKKAFVVNFIKSHYKMRYFVGEIDGFGKSWTVKFTDIEDKAHEVHFHGDQFCEVIG